MLVYCGVTLPITPFILEVSTLSYRLYCSLQGQIREDVSYLRAQTLIAVTSSVKWSALVDSISGQPACVGSLGKQALLLAPSDLHAEDCDDADIGWLAELH